MDDPKGAAVDETTGTEEPRSGKPTVHLICNAHLDPVWQWRWEEGASEAVATFRVAAAHPGRASGSRLLPQRGRPLPLGRAARSRRSSRTIRRLVKAGRWAIAGGWYLQPDANLPGIESVVRQIAEGRRYFRDRFGVAPRVAYNFDSFGHGAGLPQVLRQAGYKMYIHMRPQAHELRAALRPLPLARRGRLGDPGLPHRGRALPHRIRQHRRTPGQGRRAGLGARPRRAGLLGHRRPRRRPDPPRSGPHRRVPRHGTPGPDRPQHARSVLRRRRGGRARGPRRRRAICSAASRAVTRRSRGSSGGPSPISGFSSRPKPCGRRPGGRRGLDYPADKLARSLAGASVQRLPRHPARKLRRAGRARRPRSLRQVRSRGALPAARGGGVVRPQPKGRRPKSR